MTISDRLAMVSVAASPEGTQNNVGNVGANKKRLECVEKANHNGKAI